jgi:hypothetical protein
MRFAFAHVVMSACGSFLGQVGVGASGDAETGEGHWRMYSLGVHGCNVYRYITVQNGPWLLFGFPNVACGQTQRARRRDDAVGACRVSSPLSCEP